MTNISPVDKKFSTLPSVSLSFTGSPTVKFLPFQPPFHPQRLGLQRIDTLLCFPKLQRIASQVKVVGPELHYLRSPRKVIQVSNEKKTVG